jgi:hypothetical protein
MHWILFAIPTSPRRFIGRSGFRLESFEIAGSRN